MSGRQHNIIETGMGTTGDAVIGENGKTGSVAAVNIEDWESANQSDAAVDAIKETGTDATVDGVGLTGGISANGKRMTTGKC